MDKPQIIGIGTGGLVGSRILELLADKIDFISLSTSKGVDITKPETLTIIKNYSKANYILHMAAKTDVDSCEKDNELKEAGEAWKINVQGTRNVAEIARETGKKVIYISTDFVFDGEKPIGEAYSELDKPNPINWYAKTKYEGEKAIIESGIDFIILRIAYPFRANFDSKLDFMRAIKYRLEQKSEIKAVVDHIFCPTYIDDIAIAIEDVIEKDQSGIFHVVGSEKLTPFEAAIKIAEVFNLDKSLISKTTRNEFFKDRAPRPFNLALLNAKIIDLGVKMKSFDESLHLIKSELK